MDQVKALYVKNLPDNTTPEQLKELFERHGEVTKVVMPPAKPGQKRDFGFIHFAERSSALKAVKETEKYEIDGHVVEACLAKPQSEKKFDAGSNPYKGSILPSYLPPGYGFPGSSYGALGAVGAGYGSPGFAQPVIYGRGPMPAGMQMVPMVLPDDSNLARKLHHLLLVTGVADQVDGSGDVEMVMVTAVVDEKETVMVAAGEDTALINCQEPSYMVMMRVLAMS
ncbi:Heteroproteinous nuclear ribonucleoprotein Q [Asimina triloba]